MTLCAPSTQRTIMITQPLVVRDSSKSIYCNPVYITIRAKSNEKERRRKKASERNAETRHQNDHIRRLLRTRVSESSSPEDSITTHQSHLLSMMDQKGFRYQRALISFEIGLLAKNKCHQEALTKHFDLVKMV